MIPRTLHPVALRAVCVLSLLSLLALLPGCESAPLVHPSPGVTCTPDGEVCWRTRSAQRQCPPEGPLPRPLPQ